MAPNLVYKTSVSYPSEGQNTMPESLKAGKYFIFNGDAFAARSHIEDKSLLPKPVYCPPADLDEPEVWVIEKLKSGRYKLSTRGSPTAPVDGHVRAILQDSPPAEEWTITPRFHLGSDLYTIETATQAAGWILAEEPKEQPLILVEPLIYLPVYPPRYGANALWEIVSAEN